MYLYHSRMCMCVFLTCARGFVSISLVRVPVCLHHLRACTCVSITCMHASVSTLCISLPCFPVSISLACVALCLYHKRACLCIYITCVDVCVSVSVCISRVRTLISTLVLFYLYNLHACLYICITFARA